ncbi:hypothetical protein L6R49_14095 [Myxococcota bacterium]|nr:hypothetical protein [Myxococcota bacterium]
MRQSSTFSASLEALPRAAASRSCALCCLLVGLVACNIDNTLRGQDEVAEEEVFVTETFEQASLPRIDVLWVVDSTASMADEQLALGDAFPALASSLGEAGLSFQLGVVTTEVDGLDGGVLQGDPWIITSNTPDAAAAFADAVAVGSTDDGPEAGLAAMKLALTEPNRSGANRGFRRADAALHVVVVSDDDDHSDAWLGEDPASVALELLAAESAASGSPALFSAVIGAPETGCRGEGGQAQPGDRYAQVALASGGVVEDICQSDLSALASRLGELSQAFPTRFLLQSEPYKGAARVSVDGARLDSGWELEVNPPAVVFDEAPAPGAIIEVTYQLPPEVQSDDGEGS